MGIKKVIHWLINKVIRERKKIINAETIIIDSEWEKLKKLIGRDYEWYIITPANYDYCKSIFNLKIGKNKFTEILKNRVRILKENNEKIQIAIHLCKVEKFLDNQLQEEK